MGRRRLLAALAVAVIAGVAACATQVARVVTEAGRPVD
jgi:hypothetical protein